MRISEDVELSIEEDWTEGGLGAIQWAGGVRLAECLANYSVFPESFFADKRVIELGAGLGAAAITSSKLGAKHVVATDAPEALDKLKTSVALNQADIQVESLVWSVEDLDSELVGRFDVSLTADCFYLPQLVAPLLSSAAQVLEKKSSSFFLVNGVIGEAAAQVFREEWNKYFSSIAELCFDGTEHPIDVDVSLEEWHHKCLILRPYLSSLTGRADCKLAVDV